MSAAQLARWKVYMKCFAGNFAAVDDEREPRDAQVTEQGKSELIVPVKSVFDGVVKSASRAIADAVHVHVVLDGRVIADAVALRTKERGQDAKIPS